MPPRRSAKSHNEQSIGSKTQPVVTEQIMLQSKMDLVPVGLNAAMQQLKDVQPELHRVICEGTDAAFAVFDDQILVGEPAIDFRRAVEQMAVVLVQAVQHSHGTALGIGSTRLRRKSSHQSVKHKSPVSRPRQMVTAFTALLLKHQPERSGTPGIVAFSLDRGQGIADHIALHFSEAIKLTHRLIEGLIHGGCEEAIVKWGNGQSKNAASHVPARHADTTASSGKKSDRLVTRERLMWEERKVRKEGDVDALLDLGSIEPSIANYIKDTVIRMLKPLRDSTGSDDLIGSIGIETTVMTTTIIRSMQKAHYDLWCDLMAGTRLGQIDPDLKQPRSK